MWVAFINIQSIWSKAIKLVSKENAIVNAPGTDTVKICASYSTNRPHIVTMYENGKITCDCKNNESLTLCSHAIAVAEKGGCLQRLIDWYKQTKQSANLWRLSRTSNVPKRPGAKPNQCPPKKAKTKIPILTYSDEDACTSKLSIPTKSQPGPSAVPVPPPVSSTSTTYPLPLNSQPQWCDGASNYCNYNYGAYQTSYRPMFAPATPYYPYCNFQCMPPQTPPKPEIQHNSNPFIATVRSGNVSKCASCSGTFTRNEQVVVLKHVEKSLYVKDGETRIGQERPHYYHALAQCILPKHPYFMKQMLQVDSDMYDILTTHNKELLDSLYNCFHAI